MDPRCYMIIDSSKAGSPKMFITSQVSSIEMSRGMWHVKFNTSPITYTYRHERIKILKDPQKVELGKRGFYIRNKHIENIRELYCFKDSICRYYHAVNNNGKETDYTEKDVYVSRTSLKECDGGSIWEYLCHLAAETGMELGEVGNILKMQYDLVDEKRDNVPLVQFVGGGEKLSVYTKPQVVIFPFGCNASQKQGVENALTHQASIIQGPPGTGKTQTILNIIANLLIWNKSVLVVSNNNSAIENVAEKLSNDSVGLDFLVAELGKKENKEAFVSNQPELPDMSGWVLTNSCAVREEIKEILKNTATGFEKQTELSLLTKELEALKTEIHYNEILHKTEGGACECLAGMTSKRLLELKLQCEGLMEESSKIKILFFYLRWMARLGIKAVSLLRLPFGELLRIIDAAYYTARLNETKKGIARCEAFLKNINLNESLRRLNELSLKLLKHFIASDRAGYKRPLFSIKDIKARTQEFLKEYPVVLSTTYSAKNCLGKDSVFDYVIMDEASQVDITTGALALSCAMNAVIVGDDKQLPNVIDEKTRSALKAIECRYRIDDKYRLTTHSFLQSCCEVFTDAPQTLLREHYRCHPKIIEFCNHLFYDGQLLAMTRDAGEKDVLSVIRTPKGQHARGHVNQREIDIIREEVMPKLEGENSVGIITPYRDQAEEINRQLGKDMASTVHKYQGRECSNIIMSLVDNEVKDFSDDPNLMNVAISRAKDRLFIVTSGNDIDEQSNIGQLIAYANYNNFNVKESKLCSVFDILYKQYSEERLSYKRAGKENLEELSESLIYNTLNDCILELKLSNAAILCHYPLARLIVDDNILTAKEKQFAHNPLTHVDFLLYNSLTKRPLMCVEVDGWAFHQTDVQKTRDQMKDEILGKYRLPLLRISTTETITKERLMAKMRSYSLTGVEFSE